MSTIILRDNLQRPPLEKTIHFFTSTRRKSTLLFACIGILRAYQHLLTKMIRGAEAIWFMLWASKVQQRATLLLFGMYVMYPCSHQETKHISDWENQTKNFFRLFALKTSKKDWIFLRVANSLNTSTAVGKGLEIIRLLATFCRDVDWDLEVQKSNWQVRILVGLKLFISNEQHDLIWYGDNQI